MAERPGVAQQAEILARQGRVDAAVAACYDALAIDHGQPHIRALLAHLMLEGDFYDEAIAEATAAIERIPAARRRTSRSVWRMTAEGACGTSRCWSGTSWPRWRLTS